VAQTRSEPAFHPRARGIFSHAVSRWRTRSCAIIGSVLSGAALVACGGGQRQDANEPSGNFPVQVAGAQFPSSQRLSEHTHLVITVRNSGSKTIPNIAVTICNVTCAFPAPLGEGTSVEAFASYLNMPNLASHSRPVWVIDQAPGPCDYSCNSGGPGGAVTAYANTWALGSLKPGGTATFKWGVTAVQPGSYKVAWQIAAGLNGKAKAILSDGSKPRGTFNVKITHAPAQSYVNNNGQVVTTSQ
jgi:hypothetical protein